MSIGSYAKNLSRAGQIVTFATLFNFTVSIAWATEAVFVSGTVFQDDNGDGKRDSTEPGLAEVSVSNGIEITFTNQEGHYELPVNAGQAIFVIKPRNYRFHRRPDGQPDFYEIYAPDGSPDHLSLRYPGLLPSGHETNSIDFALIESPEPDSFSAAVLADTQVQSDSELTYLREDIITELMEVDAAFAIIAGDLVFDNLALLPRLNRLFGRLDYPWYAVPGNHDVNFQAPDDAFSLETYKSFYGPPYYSFNVGPAHFVVLDSVSYLGPEGRILEATPGEDPRTILYEGRLSQNQLTWLAADLATVPKDQLVVVVMHIPVAGRDNPELSVLNGSELLALLGRREHLLILSGHLHRASHHYHPRSETAGSTRPVHEHVLGAASGGWWGGPLDADGIAIARQSDGTPNGYYLLTVTGNDAKMRFKAARRPADHQMRVHILPVHGAKSTGAELNRLVSAPIPVEQLPAMEIVVNFFESGPKSEVHFALEEHEPILMTRSPRKDPAQRYLENLQRDRRLLWPKPKDSNKIWVAPLPRDLDPGLHRLTVEATDDYGQQHAKTLLFEVAP